MKLPICFLFFFLPLIVNGQSNLFWSEFNPSSVKSLESGSIESTTVLRDIVNNPSAITVDREGGYIYYSNKGSESINRCNLDGSDVVTLITNTINAKVIRIDHENDKIYYGDINVARLLRTDLDGSNKETLFQSNNGVGIYGLELDIENNRIFFSTYDNVYVSDLNAESPQIIVSDLTKGRNIALDRINSKIYYLDAGFGSSSPPAINRCNYDGSDIEILDIEGADDPGSMAIDFENEIIYWADEELKALMSFDINGGNVQTVLELNTTFSTFEYSLGYDAEDRRLYWTDTSVPALQWINTETGEVVTLLSDQMNDPGEMIVDHSNKKLYRTDGFLGLYRSNFDGTNPEKIINSGSGSSFALTSEHLYYYSSSNNGIMRTNKDGTDEVEIVSLTSGNFVRDLAVDESNGVIVWIDVITDRINKANIDGSQVELLTFSSLAWSLALNPSSQTIYYTSRSGGSSSENNISSIDYNGGNKEVIVNAEDDYMGWITIDTLSQKIYWTEGVNAGGIYEMDIDGFDKMLIQLSEIELRGIAYYNENITSTENPKNSDVKIYPVPSRDYVNLESEDAIKVISVLKLDGVLIARSNFEKGTFNTQINLESQPPGQYIITIEFYGGNKRSEIIQILD